MLTPRQFVDQLTPEEITGLVQQVGTKEFDVENVARDENLDPEVLITMRQTHKERLIKVKPMWLEEEKQHGRF